MTDIPRDRRSPLEHERDDVDDVDALTAVYLTGAENARTLARQRIADLTAERDSWRAEAQRLRAALYEIAGEVPFADDPWDVACRALGATDA